MLCITDCGLSLFVFYCISMLGLVSYIIVRESYIGGIWRVEMHDIVGSILCLHFNSNSFLTDEHSFLSSVIENAIKTP